MLLQRVRFLSIRLKGSILIGGRFQYLNQTSCAFAQRLVYTTQFSGCHDIRRRRCLVWMDASAVSASFRGTQILASVSRGVRTYRSTAGWWSLGSDRSSYSAKSGVQTYCARGPELSQLREGGRLQQLSAGQCDRQPRLIRN